MKLFGALVMAFVISVPAATHACTPPLICQGSAVLPLPGVVPANAAFEWWVNPGGNAHTDVRLQAGTAEGWRDLPMTLTLSGMGRVARAAPREALPVGARVRFTSTGSCPSIGPDASPEYTVAPTAPEPTTLGTLTATAPALAQIQHGGYTGSACAHQASAIASVVSVNHSPEAAPWASSFYYEALVNGSPYIGWVTAGYPWQNPTPGATWAGRGHVLLASICGPATPFGGPPDPVDRRAGLPEGEYEVVFRARRAGTDAWVMSSSTRVVLRCPPGSAGDAGTVSDAGAWDGAVVRDATVDGGTRDGGVHEGGMGCTCGVIGSASPTRPWALVLLVAALAAAASRRAASLHRR